MSTAYPRATRESIDSGIGRHSTPQRRPRLSELRSNRHRLRSSLLTLLALGYLTIDDIPGTVTVKATYEPDPAAGEVYAALLKEFVNLYEKTKGIHKRLNGRRLIG